MLGGGGGGGGIVGVMTSNNTLDFQWSAFGFVSEPELKSVNLHLHCFQ